MRLVTVAAYTERRRQGEGIRDGKKGQDLEPIGKKLFVSSSGKG